MLDYIYLTFIFLSMILGFVFVKRQSLIGFRLMLLYIVITFLNETFCFYVKAHLQGVTISYYNIYYYFRFVFLGYVFLSFFKKYLLAYKLLFTMFCLLSVLLFFYCYHKYSGIKILHTDYFFAGCSFIIFSALFYLLELYQRTDDIPLFDNIFFISTVALLLYFVGVMPFTGIINLLMKKNSNLTVFQPIIGKSLSIVFYSLLGFDFYIQWKNLKLKY